MKCQHLPKKTIGNFLYRGGNDDYQSLKNELIQGFGLSTEMILEIDLDNYKEGFQKSTLIGSPPGYVGYENGGILSTHLNNYPGALISLLNFDKASGDIKSFFYNMMTIIPMNYRLRQYVKKLTTSHQNISTEKQLKKYI